VAKKLPENLPAISQWGGSLHKIARYPTEDTKVWSAFNPSIAYSKEDGIICLIRSSNYYYDRNGHTHVTAENTIKNSVFFARLDENLKIKDGLHKVTFIDGPHQRRGCEDAKLFRRENEWYFHAVMKEDDHTPYPRICIFRLDIKTLEATFIKKFDSYEYNRVEKNWMTPMEKSNPNFEFIYGPTSIYKDGKIISNAVNPPKEAIALRGGTNLLELEDGYLAVGHRLYVEKNVAYNPRTFSYVPSDTRKYSHRFLKFDYRGELTHMTEAFVFEKFIIEFASGIIQKDKNYIVSFGRHDLSSNICVIEKKAINERLVSVHEQFS
jgi:predicted GH43/DUF377 family glycosyl hydrolase